MTTIDYEAGEGIAIDIDATFHPDYSGRAMYGETCVGWSGNFSPLELAAALQEWLEYDAHDWAKHHRTDSLGLGEIHYFPGITVEGY